ncbi:MAG: endonuclease Q family protein [Patescibacteria group bacterium]|nr:endonuclease Q family protein [Patescibacteria group bacterium]MDD5164534.1 endonuclease Q family protein [Patescibacteria group bacterium]MDD5534724.1 endonuclease Q family protein [Patescibacteria group bacterium]
MKYIADFHIHSKYSRATAHDISVEKLDQWAKIKGIQILGTGDFTHPAWFKELKEKLEQVSEGVYELNSKFQIPNSKFRVRFILTTEISCIYKKNNKTRRIHLVIFAPDFETAEKINQNLGEKYNLKSDGRPILGLDAKELVKILLDISPKIFIVPAHIWTPWFSLFGSMSGFDSVEECFEEMTPNIYALETGLSSDPLMNWQWSYLDKYTLISNSDAHSPSKLGREANVFEFKKPPSYDDIINAIKTKKNFLSTIEFFPEEGKYHFDGHRDCKIRMTPAETKRAGGLCPKCRRPMTIGVAYRVAALADRKEAIKPKDAPDFKSLIPLTEIIHEVKKVTKLKSVELEYQNLTEKGHGEFNVLLNLSEKELADISTPLLAQAIIKMRKGEVTKEAGYDGVFGKISVFGKESQIIKTFQKKLTNQKSLFK